tara:strand:- start:166 stop:345 length:180 start_codon:yes stop_codon:yes gene_type:complete
MTKKELKEVERIAKKIIDDLLTVEEVDGIESYNEFIFTTDTLDKIEDYLGHPVDFMGIS